MTAWCINSPPPKGIAMNWDNLKIFLEVAEATSMRAAAKKLKVSHSKVSRRIESLEIEIGVK